MVVICSLSNSKIRLLLILKKHHYFIDKIFYVVLYIFFIRSDSILGCHMVMLQRAPEILQCTPPTGHVVTFHFQFLRVNKEKCINCNYETK